MQLLRCSGRKRDIGGEIHLVAFHQSALVNYSALMLGGADQESTGKSPSALACAYLGGRDAQVGTHPTASCDPPGTGGGREEDRVFSDLGGRLSPSLPPEDKT